jgi:hypothetical protein
MLFERQKAAAESGAKDVVEEESMMQAATKRCSTQHEATGLITKN